MDDLSDLIWKDQPVRPSGAKTTSVPMASLAARPNTPRQPTARSTPSPSLVDESSGASVQQLISNYNRLNPSRTPPTTNGGQPKPPRAPAKASLPATARTPNQPLSTDPFDNLLGFAPPAKARAGSPALDPLMSSGLFAAKPAGKGPSLAQLEKQRTQRHQTQARQTEAQWDLDFLEAQIATKTTAASPPTRATSSTFASLLGDPPTSSPAVPPIVDPNPLGIQVEPAIQASPMAPLSPSLATRTGSPIPMFDADEPCGDSPSSLADTSLDELIAQLVALGFTADQAQTALIMTASGRDVAEARDLLMQNQRAQQTLSPEHGSPLAMPTVAEPPADIGQQFQAQRERIFATANDFSASVFTKASSLFQKGKSRIQQTIEELQAEGVDRSHGSSLSQQPTPRWMADGAYQSPRSSDEDLPTRRPTRISSPKPKSATYSDDESMPARRRSKMQSTQLPKPAPPCDRFISDSSSDDDAEAERRYQAEIRARKQAYYCHQPSKRPAPMPNNSPTPAMHRSVSAQTPKSSTPHLASPASHARSPSSGPTNAYQNPPNHRPTTASLEQVVTAYVYKTQGNRRFKLGQFIEAAGWYTRALETLPVHHVLRMPLYNNRILANLKVGEYPQVVTDCETILTATAMASGTERPVQWTPRQRQALQHGWYWWSQQIADTINEAKGAQWSTNPRAWTTAVQGIGAKLALTLPDLSLNDPAEHLPLRLADLSFSVLDQRLKALQRKASALEATEKLRPALTTYTELQHELNLPIYSLQPPSDVALGRIRNQAQESVHRISKLLAAGDRPTPAPVPTPTPPPPRPAAAAATASPQPPADRNPFRVPDDPLRPMPLASTPASVANNAEASSARVQELRAQERQRQEEDRQRHLLKDSVDARILRWKHGNETNLRTLLINLDTVLWADLAWKTVGLPDLISNAKVKRVYLQAISKIHPDKLKPSTVVSTVEQQMLANSIFSTLNDAWFAFKTQNNM
ncbi:auxilin-like clathrin-binding protein required for normal clathrin function [Dimargaris verticillata]|uniref:Auxilin-like clathrin-binding protein required for normal clathrin function n=1 Tax=Dimargaris verticillata TaxID=2761393 RepID=A0A9W8B5L1_9FUNG|nr:auxilin-like clathrin-binding protein required for normal clathrin function [Dimargaris verticillata]